MSTLKHVGEAHWVVNSGAPATRLQSDQDQLTANAGGWHDLQQCR